MQIVSDLRQMQYDSDNESPKSQADSEPGDAAASPVGHRALSPQREIGGPQGPEPTRFGDWERQGRCIDF
jgi:hypothetical protein